MPMQSPITEEEEEEEEEEELREASCIGDIEAVQDILGTGINVNAKHEINGWTPLHWAAKRGHKAIVSLLLAHGADPTVVTNKNETPAALCTVPEICQLLEPGGSTVPSQPTSLPITPHYLKHPPLDGMSSRKGSALDHPMTTTTLPANKTSQQCNGTSSNEEIVLKVRLANTGDPDFIEIEFPRKDLTYSRLLRVCCEELGVSATQVVRIRKLPDTLIRKDKDVQRFKDFQEIEVVVASTAGKNKLIPGSNGLIHVPGLGGSTVNGYQSISLYKNQTILY